MTPPVLIQARLESTRLPQKMLAPILGQAMLLHQLDRLSVLFPRERLVVITANTVANQGLRDLLGGHGYQVLIPHVPVDDVLARYAEAAQQLEAEAVVRVTGDSPLIDPTVVAEAIQCFAAGRLDYVALASQWPDGLDVECISAQALYTAHAEATEASDREHVSP